MTIIQSLVQILISYGLLFLLGLGLVLYCLPAKFRGYSFYIAPVTGYVAFCFLSIWISGISHGAIIKTNLWAFLALGLLTVAALLKYRSEIFGLLRSTQALPLLIGVMLAVVFSPVLQQGLDLYIGTANPDFYQSLSLHEVLVRFEAKFWIKHTDLPLAGPFLEMFPAAFQARFGGVVFSVLLEQLLGISSRTALMTAVIVFLLCLPTTVYFFSSAVLEFNKRESTLSAFLVAIVAPTTMSFVHTFVGQNAALATFPLAIGLIYLALKERSITLAFLAALVLNGMFWIYVMALPYVLAPFGLYGVMKFFRQGWRNMGGWLIPICVFFTISAAVHFSVFSDTRVFINNLTDLLSKLTQSHYYADFLTEEVFQYASGLTSYPLSQSMYFHSVSHLVSPVLIALAILLGGMYLLAVRFWAKTASQDAVLITLSLIVTYVVVWGKYTFITRYGYASFKMSAWLQFLVTPFFAWCILRNWEVIRKGDQCIEKWRSYIAFALLVPVYVGLNLASDLDYGLKSYGRDRLHGSLINSYGIAGNKDFVDLPTNLQSSIPTRSSVALGFGDSIENFWAAYYANKSVARISILTHEEIPFEDALLPNIHSRKYMDSLGQIQMDTQKYFHGGLADYYLLPGLKNLNTEIIDSAVMGRPLWSNDTFALYKTSDIKDLIAIGRGFYRVEHMDISERGWWWPETFRWSAEGGEIYHFMPSQPGRPYRVEFSAITGLGRISGKRTIELWHNETKFDEVVIEGAARIVSRPYLPVEGVNRLVILVKEKSVLVSRNTGLWNRDLPRRSTPINMLFSNIRLVNDSQNLPRRFPVNKQIEAKDLFNNVESFNGFDVDGWIRDRCVFTASVPSTVNRAIFNILVPGNLGFGFPYKIQFILNGVSFERTFSAPGEYTVDLDLQKVSATDVMKVEIIPQEAKRIAEGMEQREVLQSIRLSSVKFSTH